MSAEPEQFVDIDAEHQNGQYPDLSDFSFDPFLLPPVTSSFHGTATIGFSVTSPENDLEQEYLMAPSVKSGYYRSPPSATPSLSSDNSATSPLSSLYASHEGHLCPPTLFPKRNAQQSGTHHTHVRKQRVSRRESPGPSESLEHGESNAIIESEDGRSTESRTGMTTGINGKSTEARGQASSAKECRFRCENPICLKYNKGQTFTKKADLDRHTREQHEKNPLTFICGSCKFFGAKEKSFKRWERLTAHIDSAHPVEKKQKPVKCCTHPCLIEGSNRYIFFPSEHELDRHLLVHTQLYRPQVEPSIQHAISHDADPNEGQTLASSPDTSTESVTGAKHSNSEEWRPPAKRGKYGDIGVNGRPQVDHNRLNGDMESEQAEVLDGSIWLNGIGAWTSAWHPDQCVEEIHDIRIIEMCALSKRDDFEDALDRLQELNVSSHFSVSKGAIKLEGERSATRDAKTAIERALKKVRDFFPKEVHARSLFYRDYWKKEPSYYFDNGSPSEASSCGKISAITAEEDSEVLTTWHEYILPHLHEHLDCRVGTKYSAALVKQQNDLGDFEPVIRIESASGQGENVQHEIRSIIRDICHHHRRQPILVLFSKGDLVLLAGASNTETMLPGGQPNELRRFPHHRRYWGRPGMGASIGLQSCDRVSATLGGYILIDGVRHMLTVAHFIKSAQEFGSSGQNGNPLWITSPSGLDVNELGPELEQKIRDVEAKLKMSCPFQPIPLRQLQETGFPVDEEIEAELNFYENFRRDLERKPNDFVMGQFLRRSDIYTRSARALPGEFRLPEGSQVNRVGHRLDWSISTVSRNRAGRNFHRHSNHEELQVADFRAEAANPEGMGSLCEYTAQVQPKDQVHYVGQTSGRQGGVVNAALVLVRDGSDRSYELAIDLPLNEQKSGGYFGGDSGAWIIRDSDKALLGMLWGWSNSQLLFTPIADIFDDIKRTVNAREVGLPRRPAGLANAVAICRVVKNDQAPQEDAIAAGNEKHISPSSPPPAAAETLLISPKSIDHPPTIESPVETNHIDALRSRSTTSVPSVSSSIPSTPELLPQNSSEKLASELEDSEDSDDSDVANSTVDSEHRIETRLDLDLTDEELPVPFKRSGIERKLSLGFILQGESPVHGVLGRRKSVTWPIAQRHLGRLPLVLT